MTISESQNSEWKESWGRGIEKIFVVCYQAGLPQPQYSDTGATLRLTLPYATRPESDKSAEENVRINDRINVRIKLNTTEQKIIVQLKKNPDYTAPAMLYEVAKHLEWLLQQRGVVLTNEVAGERMAASAKNLPLQRVNMPSTQLPKAGKIDAGH